MKWGTLVWTSDGRNAVGDTNNRTKTVHGTCINTVHGAEKKKGKKRHGSISQCKGCRSNGTCSLINTWQWVPPTPHPGSLIKHLNKGLGSYHPQLPLIFKFIILIWFFTTLRSTCHTILFFFFSHYSPRSQLNCANKQFFLFKRWD